MLNRGMAKNPGLHPPVPAAPTAKRPRGRPPSPGGPEPQAEIQRAYRVRKAAQAAGAAAARPDLKAFLEMRDKLHNALLELEPGSRTWRGSNSATHTWKGELKLEAQHHTNALKDIVLLKRELAQRG
jgi:hypothetical protein